VGRGPAVIGRSDKDIFMDVDRGPDVEGDCSTRIVAPGDRVVLVFREDEDGKSPPASTFGGQAASFVMSVAYTDISYGRQFRGRFVFNEERTVPVLLDATIEDPNSSTIDRKVPDETGNDAP
jgi:hypothetical protein